MDLRKVQTDQPYEMQIREAASRPHICFQGKRSIGMPDIGNPAGFDIATVLTGSGITLLLSAGIMRYGERFSYTTAELYGLGGAGLVALGVVFGLVLVVWGYR